MALKTASLKDLLLRLLQWLRRRKWHSITSPYRKISKIRAESLTLMRVAEGKKW